jgi:hypothetical protein
MNRLRSFGASAAAAVVAAALVVGLGMALASVGPARAAPAPEFTLVFTGLQPGVPQTDSGTFSLDRDADLVLFEWLEQTGVLAPDRATLDVEVCDSAGTCLDPRTLTGPVAFAAGTATLSVTAELTAPADNGEAGTITGRLSFTADDELAASGWMWMPWITAALAALSVGALVLAITGHRRASADTVQVASQSSR